MRRHALQQLGQFVWSRCPQGFRSATAARVCRRLSVASDPSGVQAVSDLPRRESMEYDVVIVGAGPAGLSAAIRIKQLCAERERDLSVCIVEKGSEVGAHILSGNVFSPRALDELIPDWRTMTSPIQTPVARDRFLFMTEGSSFSLPTPPQMNNNGNYIVSLSKVCRWLGERAEELGVEIYPGFSAREVVYRSDQRDAVKGIATGDMGIAKDGSLKSSFERGLELHGKVTLFGEGCRGSLSQELIHNFSLREKAGAQPQTYALGIKEVWQVPSEKHQPGTVWHSIGWPLPTDVYGGSFLYHMEDGLISIGFVVGLDYKNPYLDIYQEFQRFKMHPAIRPLLEAGECVQYGARTLNEGGFQSIPELVFPGGALIGCSAGFLNVPQIKGTHTAMKSAMLAAEAAVNALLDPDADQGQPITLDEYTSDVKKSWVWEELRLARNIRPGFKHGLYWGTVNAAVDTYLFRGRAPWTLKHEGEDYTLLEPAVKHVPIDYPKPDNIVSFDNASSLHRSGTNHDHDQPAHLLLLNDEAPSVINKRYFDGPETRYCPARVYEYVVEDGKSTLQINAQNCLHCKACDIKDPTQNIRWVTPEGAGGPKYTLT
mmetsp:Transcript_11165/g.40947  ORF Transcript_11165/g.40947 Transcript_11165/m.40947 type:complete len:600 (-) Transcript_11165:568-2367(-)